MEKSLISYVVTTYNCEKFAEEAIKCALAQTYSPLEIVVCDDASTDNTFEVIQGIVAKYDGPHKVVLYKNEKNLGITRNMNNAYLNLASGEIIVAAHGDDVSISERTQISYDYLKAHPDTMAVSMSMEAHDEKGKVLMGHSAKVNEEHVYELESLANIPAPSRCFYKKVMTTFGPLRDDCPTEDELISFRAMLLGKTAFIPVVGVIYRKHSQSSSNPENFKKFPLDRILNQQKVDMELAMKLGLLTEEKEQALIQRLTINMNRRILYRQYFADRSLKTLFRYISSPLVGFRLKIYQIREHVLYKLGRR